jgi:DNA adenine methylase
MTKDHCPALAAFPYFGGKAAPRIRNKILELLPVHTAYVEPFGGAASILLSKPPSPIETYNDINGGVVGFFRVVSDPVLFHHLQLRLALLPVSRELYGHALLNWEDCQDPVERAALWYVVARQSFGGMFGGSWGTVVGSSSAGRAQTVSSWIHGTARLGDIHARMRGVQIEHADWRRILDRYDGPGYLAYVDPPYVLSTRKGGGYANEMTDADHQDLVRALMSYQGAVVLSGYASPLYHPLEAAGWSRHDVDVCCSAAGRTRSNGLKGAGQVLANQRRVESIWTNPEAQRRKKKG